MALPTPDYHFVFTSSGVYDKIADNTASYTSGVSHATGSGLYNDAADYGEFDGTSSVAVISSYDPPQKGFISCWIRTSSTGSRIRFFGSDDAFEGTKESNGVLSNQCFHSGNATETSGTDYGDGNWYHLVLTWDYANTSAELYVDKTSQASTSSDANDIPGTGDFRIGGRSQYWYGDITDFRIYEDVLPTTQDISDLYDAGTVEASTGITPDAIASTETVHEPTLSLGAVTVTLDAIASASTVYESTFVLGAVTVALDTIASTETVYEPTLSGANTVALDTIASTETVYEITLNQTTPLNRVQYIPNEDRTQTVSFENRIFTIAA